MHSNSGDFWFIKSVCFKEVERMKMTAEYSFILLLLIFNPSASSLMQKNYNQDDDMNLNLCQTIQTLSKETYSKIADLAKKFLKYIRLHLCIWQSFGWEHCNCKTKIANMRAGCTSSPRKLTCSEGWSQHKNTCYIYQDEKVT